MPDQILTDDEAELIRLASIANMQENMLIIAKEHIKKIQKWFNAFQEGIDSDNTVPSLNII